MKNVFMYCKNKDDATSYYRGWGPWTHLRRKYADVSLVMPSGGITWPSLQACDVVFMQRPYQDQDLTLAKMAKFNGLPVWVDYDDDLFNLPIDNPAYEVYSRQEIQKTIAEIIAMADVVTVTTSHLAERLSRLNKNIHIVPNALNPRISRSMPIGQRNKMVLWRGSPTHVQDLMAYADDIVEAIKANAEWTWVFLGWRPWFIERAAPKGQVVYMPAVDVVEYQDAIHKLAPSVLMVPLHDNVFNRSKSNIAYIEAAYSGATPVVPDWEEWRHLGALRYGKDAPGDSFYSVLMRAINMSDEERAYYSGMALGHALRTLSLDTVNLKRAEILDALTR